ncbi:MICOS complex subunit MIC60 [Novosphingobium huizhouense]|uniref:MICOS complex subunit MIC60 n=1 Tax=Novosphingobium huizhouense TaxID=2866625 RepID=UPI001CD89F9C|nr:MICOS complex subunit MIC60 [Novosphingobium huizhouense]
MQDTTYPEPGTPRTAGRGRGSRALVAVLVLVMLLGVLAAASWLGWKQGWLHLSLDGQGPVVTTSPTPTQSAQLVADRVATEAALAGAAAKVSALEQRLVELNQQAIAASGQARHAEALLLAVAARRAVERGAPLGYLENQLRVRFGESQPGAVDRLLMASQKPVTLASLDEEFERIAPRLSGGRQNEGNWDWLKRQIGSLVVIRHDETPSPTPENRIERARYAIAGGRIDAAIAEVERMPGRDAAIDWLAHARDYVMTQRALDQLETSALTLPEPVQITAPAPTPATTPPPAATPAPGPSAPQGTATP